MCWLAAPRPGIVRAVAGLLVVVVEAARDRPQPVADPASGDSVELAAQMHHPVVAVLAPEVEGTYVEGVARAAANAGGGLPEAFFALVGDTLKKPRFFLRADILNGLLPDLVTERNSAGLSWLIDALQTEDARRSAPANAFSALAEVVRTSHGHDEDDDQRLQHIATLIGLELESNPTSSAPRPLSFDT